MPYRGNDLHVCGCVLFDLYWKTLRFFITIIKGISTVCLVPSTGRLINFLLKSLWGFSRCVGTLSFFKVLLCVCYVLWCVGTLKSFQSSPVCEPCAGDFEIFRKKSPVLGSSLELSLELRSLRAPRLQKKTLLHVVLQNFCLKMLMGC